MERISKGGSDGQNKIGRRIRLYWKIIRLHKSSWRLAKKGEQNRVL